MVIMDYLSDDIKLHIHRRYVMREYILELIMAVIAVLIALP